MERNREGRRANIVAAAAPNGLSRRRHRSGSLRDSPDEDIPVEMAEPRLRDRGLKKDRDRDRDRGDRDRDRDRERERERSSLSLRSKRRRENRIVREDGGGEDTSEESVNDEEDEDDDAGGGGGGVLRMLLPSNPVAAAVATTPAPVMNNLHHRKSFPSTGNKLFKGAPTLKAADEMIGVSVPRKARSASTKRGHDWISGGGAVVRQTSDASLVAGRPVSPPSSSNVSIRKKMKPNGGGGAPKSRPPKSSSKSSSPPNPEELEIEIAEVLYGLMTQSQAPPSKKEIASNDSTKFDSNKSSSDAKSRVSSPISNSTPSVAPPQNSSSSHVPSSAVAPKRKRPRQVPDFSVRNSPGSSMKTEIDHQSPKTEVSSPNLENNNSGFAAENGGIPFDFSNLGNHSQVLPVASLTPAESKTVMEEEGKSSRDDLLTKEEASSPKKESSAVRLADNISEVVIATASSTVTKLNTGNSAIESQRDDKFQIDLMAPPPQLRSPDSEGAAIGFAEHNRMSSLVDAEMRQMMKDKEADRLRKMSKEEPKNVVKECEEKSSKAFVEPVKESKKPIHNKEGNIDLQLDLEKPDRERDSHGVTSISSSSLSQNQVARHHQPPPHKATKDDPNTVINAHSSSLPLPLPMSVASWPGGLPSMGYVAPLQGVVSMDGNAMPATPVQPIFTQPRPKRCATHCYIARNIHYLQQFMKMNPFWPAAASTPPMFGVKPGGNINIMPSPELHLHGNIAGRSLNSVQDKGQAHAIFPAKDKSSQAATVSDPAQRKQPVILQQALPPVGPNNILGPAFIFPFNHQHQAAAVAAASVRPSSTKSQATGSSAGSSAANSASASAPSTMATAPMSFMGGATSATPPNPMSFMGASATGGPPPTAMSFNYPPNMSANEAQYLAILQNNPYPFPIPATVGGPPNYRGNPHAQAMPMFNGSFYSSQMIHPSQLQQQQQQQQPPPAPSQPQQVSQPHQQNTSSGSSSSQKHLQMQQQRQQQQGTTINGGTGTASGNMQNYPASKVNRSSQQPQNFALMTAPTSLANVSGNNSNEKKQQHQPSKQQGGSKSGVDSHPPQTFAMSFAPMNGSSATGIDISSMAHNHAVLQSLPESSRHNYHQIVAAAVHHQAQQQKYYKISDETKAGGGGSDLSNAQDDRKGGNGLSTGKSGQSIAFSRPDVTDASGSPSAVLGNSVIDSSSRNLNLASSNPERTSRSTISNSVGTPPTSHQQLHQVQLHHQQQMLQLQKQQQQHIQNQQHLTSSLARSKNPPPSNGSSYSEHLLPSSSSSVTAKFPNSLSFPQNPVQTNNSPSQSPQWKNSSRAPTSQVPSSLASSTISSPKHHPQPQQATRVHQQSHTQISFGVNQKTSNTSQGQQPSSSNNNQCPSPPMVVGSPTTSSISKGAGGSPRTNASASTSSLSSQQQAKNSAPGPSQRSSPSILGNPPHVISSPGSKSQQQQQQLSKQTMPQQAQLFFSNPYMQQAQAQAQAQAQQPSASGYYHQRRREQSQQPPPGSSSTSSTGMLSLSSPVSGTATMDPAKAIATAASNMKGGGGGVLHATAQFVTQSSGNAHQIPAGYSYLHPVPAAVQVKPAEQKQTAGNDNLHARWQPEKK